MCKQYYLFCLKCPISHYILLKSLQAAIDIQEKEQENLREEILVEVEEETEGNIQVI